MVRMQLASKFIEVMVMDLKKIKDGWTVYFIDIFSRFTVAKRISRKFPGEVIDAYMEKWVGAGYGISSKIYHDLGGEFVSAESTSRLNINVITTAANSPFSNGICERNHSVVDDMITKMCADNPGAPIDDVISWTVQFNVYVRRIFSLSNSIRNKSESTWDG